MCSVCVRVHIYISPYIRIHTYRQTDIIYWRIYTLHTHIHNCVCQLSDSWHMRAFFVYTYVHIRIHTYTYVYIRIHTYTYVYIRIHTYKYVYIHNWLTYIHTHIHTYVHTYIHSTWLLTLEDSEQTSGFPLCVCVYVCMYL